MLTEMRTAQTVLLEFQVEMGTSPGIRLEVILVTFEQRIRLGLENLSEAEFKRNRPINLIEKMSQQHNIQAMARFVLAAFVQVYSKNQDQKVEHRDQKIVQFGQRKTMFKVWARRECY